MPYRTSQPAADVTTVERPPWWAWLLAVLYVTLIGSGLVYALTLAVAINREQVRLKAAYRDLSRQLDERIERQRLEWEGEADARPAR